MHPKGKVIENPLITAAPTVVLQAADMLERAAAG